jgi:hypothetical protein
MEVARLSDAPARQQILHAALQHGFGLVLIYGGVGALVFAVASYLVLRPTPALRLQVSPIRRV